jgi:hypothetical protein
MPHHHRRLNIAKPALANVTPNDRGLYITSTRRGGAQFRPPANRLSNLRSLIDSTVRSLSYRHQRRIGADSLYQFIEEK